MKFGFVTEHLPATKEEAMGLSYTEASSFKAGVIH